MFNHEGHEDHEGKIIEKTSCPSCSSWLISSGSGSARLGLSSFIKASRKSCHFEEERREIFQVQP
jgi:hypothetical protein